MERVARKLAWTSAVIHGLVHASVLLLPTVLSDLHRDFHVSLLSVLAVANVMYGFFGVSAIPAGVLADRLGSRTMLVVASAGCAASLLLVALAPTFALLAVGLGALGLFAGIYHPSGLSLLSRGVHSHERGRAIGIHGMGGNLGEAIAPAFAAFLAARFGWRWGFGAAAVLACACAALAATLPQAATPAGVRRTRPHVIESIGFLLRNPHLRWLLVASMAGGLVYRGVLTFLPLHFTGQSRGPLGASYLTSLVLLAGLLAQRFGGELADRLPRERLFLAEVALFVPVLVLLGLTSGAGLVACALSFGFLWYLAQPLQSALCAAYADTQDHGLLYGLQFTASFGVGSLATTLGGLLLERGGTQVAFLGFGAIALVQLAAVWALLRSVHRPTPAVASAPIS